MEMQLETKLTREKPRCKPTIDQVGISQLYSIARPQLAHHRAAAVAPRRQARRRVTEEQLRGKEKARNCYTIILQTEHTIGSDIKLSLSSNNDMQWEKTKDCSRIYENPITAVVFEQWLAAQMEIMATLDKGTYREEVK
ncbi:hypothetical protein PR202_ga28033 [Eleusine coracana subsp. coracana]|uniref:Uncharacterized protein n=1 Tax=Eleusine coracana subsp. coracana TaxID=191504 RepID=A0AAV5DHU9_ELECO|nr:hypothetical protein PR202_ga28033 [Eleusine coracana subsp. coracana]